MPIQSDRLPIVVIPADDPPLVGRSRFLDELRNVTDVQLYPDLPADEAAMLERLRPADILLNSRGHVRVTKEMLSQLPDLKMIAVCGIGYDSIDVTAANQQGIVVSNIPGRTAAIVAEHAFGLMLAVSRRMASMTRDVRDCGWSDDLGVSLLGRTVGIVGTGNIGREMIRYCRAFGMKVVAWTFHPDQHLAQELGFEYVSLENLLQSSDVVSLHVRLSDETRHLIAAPQLQQMKRSAIVINTCRGAVLDASALAEALNAGQLFGAGIDVFDPEPVAATNPLLQCDNVVLTPHSADQTQEGIDILTQGCVQNIQAFLDGKPTNVVNA